MLGGVADVGAIVFIVCATPEWEILRNGFTMSPPYRTLLLSPGRHILTVLTFRVYAVSVQGSISLNSENQAVTVISAQIVRVRKVLVNRAHVSENVLLSSMSLVVPPKKFQRVK